MQTRSDPPDAPPRTSRLAWLVGPGMLGLAAWFVWLAPPAAAPVSGTPGFERGALAPDVRDTVDGDPPLTRVGAYEYRCSDCHRDFQNEVEKTSGLVQHTGIVFDHGMNNRCFNCHDRLDRNMLVGRDGGFISYTQIPLLCAQCHGPTYRDWERGMHGKTVGSWLTGSGAQRRLTCSQCHDPHAPAFPAYVPLPGPHTLRMGGPAGAGEGGAGR